jgi:hypothetical protein
MGQISTIVQLDSQEKIANVMIKEYRKQLVDTN